MVAITADFNPLNKADTRGRLLKETYSMLKPSKIKTEGRTNKIPAIKPPSFSQNKKASLREGFAGGIYYFAFTNENSRREYAPDFFPSIQAYSFPSGCLKYTTR